MQLVEKCIFGLGLSILIIFTRTITTVGPKETSPNNGMGKNSGIANQETCGYKYDTTNCARFPLQEKAYQKEYDKKYMSLYHGCKKA